MRKMIIYIFCFLIMCFSYPDFVMAEDNIAFSKEDLRIWYEKEFGKTDNHTVDIIWKELDEYDKNMDGIVTKKEALQAKYFRFHRYEIIYEYLMQYIYYFENIQELSINYYDEEMPSSGYARPDIELSKFPKLKRIYFRAIDFDQKLDLSRNSDLEYLRIEDCIGFDTIDLQGNPELKKLYCDHLNLTSLNTANNSKLKILSCNSNNLSVLEINKNTKLEGLYCDYNRLTSLNLTRNKKLKFLRCSGNKLKKLDLQNNRKLELLACSYNNIKALNTSRNKQLININISSNKISNCDLSSNSRLQSLMCWDNRINELILNKNPEIKYINCSNNKLKKLELSNNTKLKMLYAEHNRIKKLDLKKNKQLKYLTCQFNRISEIDLKKNKKIEKISHDASCVITGISSDISEVAYYGSDDEFECVH